MLERRGQSNNRQIGVRNGRDQNQDKGGFDQQMDRGFGMDNHMALSNPREMMKRMDQMQSQMMKNFGDPFKNDPFFQDSGFGQRDSMFG